MTYRELDFSLEQIGQLLNVEPDLLAILEQQVQELAVRRQRLESIFHLKMLEDQQVGLAYYLAAAAESYASCSQA